MAEKRALERDSETESETETQSDNETNSRANSVGVDIVKSVKKRKYKTRYSKEWMSNFPFVKACGQHVPDKEYKFFCSVCNINLSCAQGGINDVKVHSSKLIFQFYLSIE